MPKVGSKHFPYTARGRAAAEKYKAAFAKRRGAAKPNTRGKVKVKGKISTPPTMKAESSPYIGVDKRKR